MTALSGAIDYWCNAFFEDREAFWQRAIERQGLSLKVHRDGDEFCSASQMVARLDESGFDTVILVVSEPAPEHNADVDRFEHVACRALEVAALAAGYPGRFRGVWSIDPFSGTDGVARAEEALVADWCVGLHNHTHSWDRPFDHPSFDAYYQLCADHDVPFVMQAGESGGDFPGECGRPSAINGPAETFASVRFVLSHTGWPWTTDAIAAATVHENVFLGTATWPLRRWSTELRDFVAGAGSTKVLFGTGFPTTGHRQAARQFADPELTEGLDADVIRDITARNTQRVFTRLADVVDPGPMQPDPM